METHKCYKGNKIDQGQGDWECHGLGVLNRVIKGDNWGTIWAKTCRGWNPSVTVGRTFQTEQSQRRSHMLLPGEKAGCRHKQGRARKWGEEDREEREEDSVSTWSRKLAFFLRGKQEPLQVLGQLLTYIFKGHWKVAVESRRRDSWPQRRREFNWGQRRASPPELLSFTKV